MWGSTLEGEDAAFTFVEAPTVVVRPDEGRRRSQSATPSARTPSQPSATSTLNAHYGWDLETVDHTVDRGWAAGGGVRGVEIEHAVPIGDRPCVPSEWRAISLLCSPLWLLRRADVLRSFSAGRGGYEWRAPQSVARPDPDAS